MKGILAIGCFSVGMCLGLTNSITITEEAGVTTANYPVQFARPFLQGEISNYPQVIINGTPVLTQADVKQRYTDGSVKHAILSFLIPSLAANSTVTVTFQNQTSGNNTPLTTTQMLGTNFNFDAAMQMAAPNCAGCQTKTASARAMLSAGAYSYWTSGPVATTVIIADHTTKAYDLGWQNTNITTFAAPVNSGDTTLQVVNATGWTAPMLVRVNNYSTDSSGGNAAEDINICAVNTSVTPNQLIVGTATACPSVAGRSPFGLAWPQGYSVYPNIWADAPNSSNTLFRPIFHATFWPGTNQVRVRYIGEVADTQKLGDQIYSLALQLGYNGPATVYTNPQVVHRAATRWTEEFWIGGPPPQIQIDHNLPYLIATKFIYNLDTSKTLAWSALQERYDAWMASPRDLYQFATMDPAMGDPGDGDNTGYYIGWDMWWLYTMDYRAQQVAMQSADLGAAWLFHMREGNASKNITRPATYGCSQLCNQSGLGHIFSLTNRTSIQTRDLARTDRLPGDDPVIVGSISNGVWSLGMNHAWEPYSPIYALTGDFWYLEEGWFWATFGAGYTLGPAGTPAYEYMRGPTGAEGTLTTEQCSWDPVNLRYYSNPEWEEIRTEAWVLRARENIAFVTPDNTVEQSYFVTLTNDAIAALEGWHNVPASSSDPSYQTIWTWANTTQYNNCGLSPLHMFSRGGAPFVQNDSPYYGIDSTQVAEANGYGVYYMMFAVARAAELGYPAIAISQWAGKYYMDLITQCSNPYLIQMGRYPTIRLSDYTWYSDWNSFRTGYVSDYANRMYFSEDGYDYVFTGMVAVGMTHQVFQNAESQQAWNFMKTNVLDAFDWTSPDVIKWAIIPRVSGSTTGLSCDLNSDGQVNILDVQLAINAALGITACGAADLDEDGTCNIVDVMRVINAALGMACVTGP